MLNNLDSYEKSALKELLLWILFIAAAIGVFALSIFYLKKGHLASFKEKIENIDNGNCAVFETSDLSTYSELISGDKYTIELGVDKYSKLCKNE